MKTYTGILREVNTLSDTCCHTSYDFECSNGEVIKDVYNDCYAPINLTIIAQFDKKLVVNYEILDSSAQSVDLVHKDIALIRPVRSDDKVTDKLWKEVRDIAKNIEQCYADQTEKLTVNVTPYVIVDEDQPYRLDSFNFQKPSVQSQLEELNPKGFSQHKYWCGYGGYQSGIQGIAHTGGFRSWIHIGKLQVFIHELGHNFGWHHSTAGMDEYGGDDQQAHDLSYLNASHVDYMNLLPDRATKIIEDTCSLFLLPLDCKPLDLREGEYIVGKILDNGRVAYIATRKPRTQDYRGTSSWRADKVIVYQPDPPFRKSYRSKDIGALGEGDTFSLEHTSVRIINQGQKDGVKRVAVVFGSDPVPEAQPFPEWTDFDTQPLSDAYDGIWADPRYEDQGFYFQVRPETNQAIGYWFTYDQDGNHQYFVYDGKIDGGKITGDVLQISAGKSTKVGDGVLRFLDDDSAVIRMQTETYGRCSFRLERFTSAQQGDIAGIWSTGDYEGFSAGEFDGTPVMYWFNSNGSWAVFVGEYNEDKTQAEFKVYITDNYYRSIHIREPEEVDQATLDLSTISNNKMTMTIDDQTLNLERVI